MPRTNIKYSKELLEPIAKECTSIAQILRKLGLVEKGGNFLTLKLNLIKFEIDTSHFKGQAWSKGLTAETSLSVKQYTDKQTKYTIETGLVNGTTLSSKATHRLLSLTGREKKCVECELGQIWNNKFIVLQIDHIDGNNKNNQQCNLRYLCPNCHTQTKTFASRNRK